jgi:hypothetical protein
VNVETKEQTQQWIYTHTFTKQAKEVKQISARKLMGTILWDS